ncbi:MAG TPA: hypothetical protein PKD61_21630 [Polyangiaceae bacterium]|nr:hypothetical protein [Polyangiaceae bacterium]
MLIDKKFLAARYWSNQEIAKLAPLFDGSVVNVSGWDDRDKQGSRYREYFTNASEYHRTNYTGHRGFAGDADEVELDLTSELPRELSRRYDVVFNHTTLEHIYEVRTAFANMCAMSRDVVIVVVPFSQVQHESDSYGDYWRFTPSCMRKLMDENGLEVIYESESPVRNAAIYLMCVGARNPDKHRRRMPRHETIRAAGNWIGASLIVSTMQFVSHRTRRLLGVNTRP